jgi:protein required for attachment to host cells
MKAPTTRIVVADGFHARLFDNHGVGKGLEPADPAEMGAAHPPGHEIVTDRPGATKDRAGQGMHAYAPTTDPKDHEKEKFVLGLGRLLSDQAGRNEFERLVLVADPKTLGQLRDSLNKAAQETLELTLDKDYTNHDHAKLEEHLGKVMAL